jgi:hypothetical protein
MSINSVLTKAARPLFLKNSEGREVQLNMSPMSDRDIEEMNEWIRARFIQNARNSLAGITDPATREETLAIAMRTASRLQFTNGTGAGMVATPEGMTQLVYLCCRERTANLTYEVVRALMFNPLNVESVNHSWREANGVTSGTQSAGERKAKAAERKNAQRRKSAKRK